MFLAKRSKTACAVALFVVLAIAVSVQARSHDHDHHHGHGHNHDHKHHDHAHHGHGHAHHDKHHHHHDHPEQNKKTVDAGAHGHSHGHAHAHDHAHDHATDGVVNDIGTGSNTVDNDKRGAMGVWVQAFSATFFISIAPAVMLPFLPIGHGGVGEASTLKVLTSFAVGGLLGDVFLHLLPHAISPHSHDNEHGHDGHSHGHDHGGHDHSAGLRVGLFVLLGLMTFFVIEKVVRAYTGTSGHSHSHSHSHSKSNKKNKSNNKNKNKAKDSDDEESDDDDDNENEGNRNAHIRVTGWLNLAADWSHNVTDGFSIAATYLVSPALGFSTTLAVFFHEIPHEIGDYAILIQSGFTRRQALLAQLSTAMGAVMGTAFGLMLDYAGIESVSSYLLPFTAGGFIYIATVGVIPELLQDCSPRQTIKEVVAMVIGIGMMVLVAIFE